MSNRMEISLTGDTFTDELHYDCGSSAFMLSELAGYPDPIENLGHDFFTKEDLVIRTASGGGGTLLAEGAGNDYLLSEEDTDLTSRVTAAVGSTRTVYKKIQIINATYQSGALYFSGKYIADANSAEDYNWQRNRPQQVNDIINGSMEISQRGVGATFSSVADGQYTIDGFEYQKGGAAVTAVHDVIHSTTTPNDEVNYSYHLDCTTAEAAVAADEYVIISHKIEGYNYQKYIGNTGTLSFWVYADKIGTYCVAFRNSGTDRCYIVEYEIRQTLTWERKVISVDFDYSGGTWNTTSGVGLEIDWVIMGGSNYQNTADQWNNTDDFCTSNQVNGCDSTDNDFYLAKIKFEPGDRATKFWDKDITTLKNSCYRYYFEPTPGAVYTFFGSGRWTAAGTALIYVEFPVDMVSTPTFGYDGALNQYALNLLGGIGVGSPSAMSSGSNGSIKSFSISCTYAAAGQTAGVGTALYTNNQTTNSIYFSAEL